MAFLKLEAKNNGNIGITTHLGFIDKDGNDVPINSTYITKHNMNIRTAASNFNELFSPTAGSASPYYEGTAKGYYIVTIPESAISLEVKNWGNTTYGKYYNIYYSEDGVSWSWVDDNTTNGDGKSLIYTLKMPSVGDRLIEPETGWKRYDDTHPAIKYNGSWTKVANATGNHLSTESYSNVTGSSLSFKFKGKSLRIIGAFANIRSNNIEITIDNKVEYYNQYNSTTIRQVLLFEKLNLRDDEHLVTIKLIDSQFIDIDAIDIDSDGRFFHPDEVVDPKDLSIGKRIRCHYQASSGQVGGFSGLGEETSDFIPPASSATPNGDFYYICVDKDHLGRWKLIADRNIQHSISWDSLNSEGIAGGSGFLIASRIIEIETVPIMTSATSPEGIKITTNAQYVNDAGWKAFDRGTIADRSYWYVDGNVPVTGNWLKIEYPSPIQINSIEITARVSNGLSGVKDFILYGSNNNVDYEPLISATHPNSTSKTKYKVDIKNSFKYYRINLLDSYNGGKSTGIQEMQLYTSVEVNHISTENFECTVRLLTGGISVTDKDNEWDQYIVNSSLNGLIVAGDNNTWNTTVNSWTSTTPTGAASSERVVRGNASVGSSAWGNNPSSITTGKGFRPVLLIEVLDKFAPTITTDRTNYLVARRNGTGMEVTVTVSEDVVEIPWGLLVRRDKDNIYWSGELQGTQLLTVTIPPRLFRDTREQRLTIEVISGGEVKARSSVFARIVNEKPAIKAYLEGYKLEVDIVDADGDPMFYEILLNGVDLVPKGNAEGSVRQNIYLNSNEIKIGQQNEIYISVEDYYGEKEEYTLPFEGKYYGLMFADQQGRYYSTDVWEILRRLVMDSVYAGETSKSYEISLINTYPFPIKDLELSLDFYEPIEKTSLRLGASETDISKQVLSLGGVLGINQKRSFYVQLKSLQDAIGKGKFRIRADARKL